MSAAAGTLHLWYRIAIALVIAVLVIYNVDLVVREQGLRRNLPQGTRAIEQLEQERRHGERLRELVVEAGRASLGSDGSIVNMLQECTSREEFAVREGPRVAWSELSVSTESAKTIGIYLPAGKHRLKCAVANRGNMRGMSYEKFQHGDASDLDAALNWEVGPQPEEYELRLIPQTDGTLQISLVGPDNVQLFQKMLPVLDGGWIFLANAVPGSLAFPSELIVDDRGEWHMPANSLPTIDMAFYDVGRRHAGVNANLRIWIESDARACISAARVVARGTAKLDGYFKPYDGSGRFYVRD
jgi:hypothetical protein